MSLSLSHSLDKNFKIISIFGYLICREWRQQKLCDFLPFFVVIFVLFVAVFFPGKKFHFCFSIRMDLFFSLYSGHTHHHHWFGVHILDSLYFIHCYFATLISFLSKWKRKQYTITSVLGVLCFGAVVSKIFIFLFCACWFIHSPSLSLALAFALAFALALFRSIIHSSTFSNTIIDLF